jgi:hypothetical protein
MVAFSNTQMCLWFSSYPLPKYHDQDAQVSNIYLTFFPSICRIKLEIQEEGKECLHSGVPLVLLVINPDTYHTRQACIIYFMVPSWVLFIQ